MISYYDLLDMIQDGEEPQLIVLHLNCGSMEYQPVYDDGEFSHYERVPKDHQSENFKFYLSDTLLESQMIEPNIEIVEEDKEIFPLDDVKEYYFSNLKTPTNLSFEERRLLDSNFRTQTEKINEIIKVVNKLTNNE